jgi:hypothetical protein
MLNIRNIAIAAVLAFVGFTAFSSTSDAAASGQNITSKITERQAAMQAALDEAQ